MVKNIIIVTVIVIIAIVAGILIKDISNKNYAIVSCNKDNSTCIYQEQNAFGENTKEKEFKFNDVIQCNIEAINKKDVKDRDVIFAYDFYLHLNSEKDPLNFQTKQRENLDKICLNFFEKKTFEYKFPLYKE